MTGPARVSFDSRAMLRYLIGWFSIRHEPLTQDRELPNIYQVDEALFYAAQDHDLVEWIIERDGTRCAFWDLSVKGVQWIRAHLLAVDCPPAPCESCGEVVTTRIPNYEAVGPSRPSCVACEVHRQALLELCLRSSGDPEANAAQAPGWRLDPGCAIQAPMSFKDDYAISHRAGQHVVSYRPKEGEHEHVTTTTTRLEALAAAEAHAVEVGAALGSADLSSCGRYRYTLTRKLTTPGSGRLVWVMLNPSTADANADDPTIRRCLGFAERLGFAELVVVNLFAWRSTDPAGLRSAKDPIGPRNDQAILRAAESADLVIAAWGAHGGLHGRDREVRLMLERAGVLAVCLGLTKANRPRHPLMLRADAEVEALPPLV